MRRLEFSLRQGKHKVNSFARAAAIIKQCTQCGRNNRNVLSQSSGG